MLFSAGVVTATGSLDDAGYDNIIMVDDGNSNLDTGKLTVTVTGTSVSSSRDSHYPFLIRVCLNNKLAVFVLISAHPPISAHPGHF